MPIDKFGKSSFIKEQPTISITQFAGGKFLKHSTPLNMEYHPIKNLPFPTDDNDAANRRYVDDKVDHLEDLIKKYIDRKFAYEFEKYNSLIKK